MSCAKQHCCFHKFLLLRHCHNAWSISYWFVLKQPDDKDSLQVIFSQKLAWLKKYLYLLARSTNVLWKHLICIILCFTIFLRHWTRFLKCLKMKTIYICLLSAHIKGRSHCYGTLHFDVYGHPRTWLIYTSGKTLYRDLKESVLPFIVYYCSCFRCYITVHDYVKSLRNAHWTLSQYDWSI